MEVTKAKIVITTTHVDLSVFFRGGLSLGLEVLLVSDPGGALVLGLTRGSTVVPHRITVVWLGDINLFTPFTPIVFSLATAFLVVAASGTRVAVHAPMLGLAATSTTSTTATTARRLSLRLFLLRLVLYGALVLGLSIRRA